MRSGIHVQLLRDSRTWQKRIARERKRAAASKQAEGPESEDEEEDNLEEDEHYDGNESDGQQSNTALTRARPSKDTMRSRPQPKKSKSDTINRQQSVQLSNDEAIQPRPQPHPTARINVSYQQSIQPSGSRSQLSRSGNLTRHGYPHPQSHTGTHYDAPLNSTRFRLQGPPSLSPSRPATKQRNPEWSDDDSAQFGTALHNRLIDTQRQFNPRSETDSWDSRNSQAIIPQQSHQRHHQHSDAPCTSTNRRPRADVL